MNKPERKTHAFSCNDIDRIDALLKDINIDLEKKGMKKANRTTLLRALIFSADHIKTEDLIEGIKQAQIYA